MEKWVKKTMPKSGLKTSVNPSIERAVENAKLGLSGGGQYSGITAILVVIKLKNSLSLRIRNKSIKLIA